MTTDPLIAGLHRQYLKVTADNHEAAATLTLADVLYAVLQKPLPPPEPAADDDADPDDTVLTDDAKAAAE